MTNVTARKNALAWLASFVVVALASVTSAAAQTTVVPVTGAPPVLTPVAINVGPGDGGTDPHVSGDWVAYSSGVSIRYYNFATNVDAQIPMGSSVNEFLSGISGSKIVYTRITAAKNSILVFDAATPAVAPVEIDPDPASNRFNPAIGGGIVAYIDYGLEGNGELVIHDLVSATSTRITNDTAFDQNPNVSADGTVVTWEHCPTTLANCDIWQAVSTGLGWVVSVVAASPSPEGNPDTNGTLIAYDSFRGADADVFWRPVGGGTEVQLLLPGDQRNPSIAGNFIAFEGRATLADAFDIFAYDIAGNRLYQITNTPGVNEQLNDIAVLPDGRLRMVWASDEGCAFQCNVHGATFSLPGAATPPVVVPVTGTTPTLTPVIVDDGPGDQSDPHVSGDWVAYTSDNSIRYYNFATHTGGQIPMGDSVDDLLSDISGSKILFSRITPVKASIMLFDAATPAVAPIEIDPAPTSTRVGSAIGGITVAYIDFGLEPNGELVIHDLISNTLARITNDTAFDQNPSVSQDGNVVTWEHCPVVRGPGADGVLGTADDVFTTQCDIWQAVSTGLGWVVSVVADSPSPEGNPNTNGTLVVYESDRGAGSDLFWRPVGGGAEIQLLLQSLEHNPSIEGNFIAFESRATAADAADIFVYDIAGNRLYQITNTPLVNEQLNDITVLPNGDLRVVWASDENGFVQRNIHAATFSLPSVSADATPPTAHPTQSPAANAAGWNTTDVTVTWNWTDDTGGSGVDFAHCTTTTTSAGEGTLTLHATCQDLAGNSNSASYTVKVDKTKPTLNPTVTPNPVVLNGTATAAANATDSGSGIASQSCGAVNTATVGTRSVSCTATDNAGNSTTASVSYSVIYSTGVCRGEPSHRVEDPIRADGTSVFKQGTTIPIEFRVCDARGVPIGTAGLVTSVTGPVTGPLTSTRPAISASDDKPTTAFHFEAEDGEWELELGTRTLAKSFAYTYVITLNDGSTIAFTFGVK